MSSADEVFSATSIFKLIKKIFFVDPPENVMIRPSSNGVVRVNEGGNLTLACYASGSPNPTYSWTRIRRFYREKLTENDMDSSYHFPYIDKSQADQYECAAINIRGRRTAVVIMDVLCTLFSFATSMIECENMTLVI